MKDGDKSVERPRIARQESNLHAIPAVAGIHVPGMVLVHVLPTAFAIQIPMIPSCIPLVPCVLCLSHIPLVPSA
jgi:hypothetical protein